MLTAVLKCTLDNATHPVDLAACRQTLLDLLRSKGHEVLSQLTIPKFAKIYILLLKLDNLAFDENRNPVRSWPSAISDLVSLPQCSPDPEHQKIHIRFIIKTMQIFDEEVVDRGQVRSVDEQNLTVRIKDWLRDNQVGQVITLLNQVLENHGFFERKTIKGTLKVLASLIDWNDVALFQECQQKIGQFFRTNELRAGAFAYLAAFVGKGMPELDKLNVI